MNCEFVLPWVAVANQGLGLRQQVLLADLDAFPEGTGRRLVQDAHPATGLGNDFDAVETGTGFAGSGADRPDLTGGKGIGVDGLVEWSSGVDTKSRRHPVQACS